ncbi:MULTISPECIES: PTS sugar transporter subunit IIB [Enorma]|uniref:PTS sugar transporter subunit IIB n=1 Tax=Enorma TaxID=1472762 RepID=UPI000344BA00|nr:MULTISPECIES: PTS sugar transporter subunit IIB [Enorma]
MKILAVCGLGQGTSLILRMNVESVLEQMGVDADVEHIDVSSAKSMPADLILTTNELADTLRESGSEVPIAIVNNYFDQAEITQALTDAFATMSK